MARTATKATPSAGLRYSENFIAGSIQTGSQIKQGALGRPKTCNGAQNEYVPHGAAGRIVAGNYWSAPRPYLQVLICKPLFGRVRRRGLVFHVDHLDAAVHFRHRLARILELALAISDGDEIGAVDAIFVDEIALDRVGAALREVLVIGFAAGRVGMARDHEGRAFEIVVGERAAERLNRRQRLRADIGRVVIEVDLQIDLRLVL